MNYTTQQITEALSHVIEPDLKKDMVSLGMIKEIEIKDNNVSFTVILTTPACPKKSEIKQLCVDAIHKHVDETINVTLNYTSKVQFAQKDKSVLPGVKNIIA